MNTRNVTIFIVLDGGIILIHEVFTCDSTKVALQNCFYKEKALN